MFFLQMAGFPGSGKSTLARAIASKTGAVIIDHDIVKTALLESPEAKGIDSLSAGKIAYQIDWSLIAFQLAQGHSVIFDSPCLYEEMLGKGIGLAERHNAKYKYVECFLPDFQEINRRLSERERLASQIEQAHSEESFAVHVNLSQKPLNVEHLVVDSGQALEAYLDEVLSYIEA
jgi:predicted kinase